VEEFVRLRALAAPLMRDNIDTDVIIRIDRLVGGRPDEVGKYAFELLRYLPDGGENPDFVLNREPFRRAQILLAGANFGCGSSREPAVWALQQMGFRCVVAPSFGDIFFANCFQNGMLPVVMERRTVEAIAAEVEADAAHGFVTVDLQKQTIVSPSGKEFRFEIEPARREALLHGLDEIGMTMRREAEIAAFQSRDRNRRPWIYR
jgi:3-isopropylmalate/(R)-2-methylmalate dehydratase small subunit